MVDFAADSVVETHRKIELRRKPYDPYGGGGEYYAMFREEKTPMFKELDQLKEYLNNAIDEEIIKGG